MNHRERFFAIMERKPVDRVSAASPLQSAILDLMRITDAWWPEAHKNAEKMAKLAAATYRVAGIEAVRVPFDITIEAEAFGVPVGKWERDTQPQLLSNLINKPEDLDKVRIPDPKRDGRLPVLLKAVELLSKDVGKEVPVIPKVESPVGLAEYLLGSTNFFKYLLTSPNFIHNVMKITTEFVKTLADELIRSGGDAIVILDASANTDYFGLDFYYKFSHPYTSELVKFIQSKGIPTIIHNCSKKPALEAVMETGTKGISIDYFVSIKEAKEQTKGRVAIFGNLAPTGVLLYGKPEDVEREARKCIDEGVDVLCSGCGLSPRTPLENVKIMVKVAREYRPRGGG